MSTDMKPANAASLGAKAPLRGRPCGCPGAGGINPVRRGPDHARLFDQPPLRRPSISATTYSSLTFENVHAGGVRRHGDRQHSESGGARGPLWRVPRIRVRALCQQRLRLRRLRSRLRPTRIRIRPFRTPGAVSSTSPWNGSRTRMGCFPTARATASAFCTTEGTSRETASTPTSPSTAATAARLLLLLRRPVHRRQGRQLSVLHGGAGAECGSGAGHHVPARFRIDWRDPSAPAPAQVAFAQRAHASRIGPRSARVSTFWLPSSPLISSSRRSADA